MKHRITEKQVQTPLDGFVQAGLARKSAADSTESTMNQDDDSSLKRERALIQNFINEFCSRFTPGATVVYIGDAENTFLHLDAVYLEKLGVLIAPAAKMPDVVVHDAKRNWLLLVEAVTSAGPVDGKRRKELKELFKGCKAGLVFVTAFEDRQAFGRFLNQISWESEVWIADAPDHIVHFNGERFLGPYPDVMPTK